ncbi:hypothetical protein RJ640_000536 [Escallonia rubra]|uniref:Reverse transcriptase Ty1/copia-type domain-containing protein n=1 Tax=Escallonia rubra TaxID=112253 RepID=A0AA88QN81_9ASTE|nr:hypothetical protein RJ640_000536 [Escallonia rubra]
MWLQEPDSSGRAAPIRYGGIYLDSDIVVLKPLLSLNNTVGMDNELGGSHLSGAVMAFRKHRYLYGPRVLVGVLALRRQNKDSVVVLFYVDDMIVTCNDEEEVTGLREELAHRCEMKSIGKPQHFPGLEVSKNKDDIFLSQIHYA